VSTRARAPRPPRCSLRCAALTVVASELPHPAHSVSRLNPAHRLCSLPENRSSEAGPRTVSTLFSGPEAPDVHAPRELHRSTLRAPSQFPPHTTLPPVSLSLSYPSSLRRHCPCSASTKLRSPDPNKTPPPGFQQPAKRRGTNQAARYVAARLPSSSLLSSPLLSSYTPPPHSPSPSVFYLLPQLPAPARPPARVRFLLSAPNIGVFEYHRMPLTAAAAAAAFVVAAGSVLPAVHRIAFGTHLHRPLLRC
jgi:hypothetical protein